MPPDLSNPALFFGGRSGTSLPLAAVFIALAIGLRVLRARGRHGPGGPWHGGPRGGGPPGGTGSDQPVQWDIRKAPQPEATPDASSEEHNPPSDL
ncbi:MAG TPA: hypothetical protein VMP41_06965 [Acidimicrobiales bacterium]|nr:hypothetical protein [Acidimicrobiales bacterium]